MARFIPMRARRLLEAGLACSITLLPGGLDAARADCPDAALARAGSGPPVLLAKWTDGEWRRVNGAPLDPDQVVQLAYVGRSTAPRERSQGALAVRISRPVARETQEPAARTVTMRRPLARNSCGFVITLLPRDYTIAQSASVDEFIDYHLRTTSNSNMIYAYHIRYASPTDGCVRTDAQRRNRRTAFLADTDGPPVPTGAVVAEEALSIFDLRGYFVGKAVAAPAQEAAPPRESRQAALRKAYDREKRTFAAFAAVESQIHTYPLGTRACAAFAPPDTLGARAGTTWVIEVVDLDGEATGKGRRQTFPVSWR